MQWSGVKARCVVVHAGEVECVGGDPMRCSVEKRKAKLSSEGGEPGYFVVKVELRRLRAEWSWLEISVITLAWDGMPSDDRSMMKGS